MLTLTRSHGLPAWISFALCAAPVVSLAGTVTLKPSADTTLFETDPDNNMGATPSLVSGTTAGTLRQPFRSRAVMRFDAAGVVPAGAVITSATLTLTAVKMPSAPSNSEFGLHRMLVRWVEGNKSDQTGSQATTGETTWNSRMFLLPQWGAPGGKAGTDFVTDTSSSAFVSGLGPYSFAANSKLVADVQFWLDNTNSNFGWILISQDESTASTARRFASREGGADAPALVLEYSAGQTQAQPPRLSQVSLLSNVVSFQFDVEPQRPYTVEFNNMVAATNWLTLTNIAAQPAPTNITVSDSGTASHRCYRVKTP